MNSDNLNYHKEQVYHVKDPNLPDGDWISNNLIKISKSVRDLMHRVANVFQI